MFQNDLQDIYFSLGGDQTSFSNKFIQVLMRIFYIYLMSFAVIAEWRSIWNLIGIYFYQDWISLMVLACLTCCFLIVARETKKFISPPFVLYIDNYENFFTSNIQLELEKVNTFKK
jgi:hypothetical protein